MMGRGFTSIPQRQATPEPSALPQPSAIEFVNSLVVPTYTLYKEPGGVETVIAEFTLPNDGKDHLVLAGFRRDVTKGFMEGGIIELYVFDPNPTEANNGQRTIFGRNVETFVETQSFENLVNYVGPGSVLRLVQASGIDEPNTGAATLTALFLAT